MHYALLTNSLVRVVVYELDEDELIKVEMVALRFVN